MTEEQRGSEPASADVNIGGVPYPEGVFRGGQSEGQPASVGEEQGQTVDEDSADPDADRGAAGDTEVRDHDAFEGGEGGEGDGGNSGQEVDTQGREG